MANNSQNSKKGSGGAKKPSSSAGKPRSASSGGKQTAKSGSQKPRSQTAKKTAADKAREEQAAQRVAAKKQLTSIILFVVGLFFLAVALIPGGAPKESPNLWQVFRNVLFGLFGICSFALPVMLFYTSAVITKDRPLNSIASRLIASLFAVIGLSSFLQLVSHEADYLTHTKIGEQANAAWLEGFKAANGGASGAVFGGGLAILFGKAGAIVTILIVLLLLIMLLTGTNMEGLLRIIRSPFGKATDYTARKIKEAGEKKAEADSADGDEAAAEEGGDSFIEEAKQYKKKNRVRNGGRDYKTPSTDKVFDPKKVTKPFDYDFDIETDEAGKNDDPDDFSEDIPGFKTPPVGKLSAFEPYGIEDELSRQRGAGFTGPVPDRAETKTDEAGSAEDDFVDISVINDAVKAAAERQQEDEPAPVSEETSEEIIEKIDSYEPSEQEVLEPPKPEHKYELPEIGCLVETVGGGDEDIKEELNHTAEILSATLKSFNIETKLVGISRGPSVTRYEIQPAPGIKISKIAGLADDIAMNLASSGVRIEAPIPNKAAVGIEVPNEISTTVSLREIVDSKKYKASQSKLTVALGKDISGNVICTDLAKMPHLLIAGTTGSGKSVCLNSMIVSILFNSTPDEVKMILIDPKQVEFTVYNGIPHLLVPVVSDPRKAAGALGWAVAEMLKRYKLFSEYGVRDFKGYNKMVQGHPDLAPMHQIVIFIDELADLMMVAQNEVEDSICRLAQMARAAGMHLVIATQRPSVDVITGIIKANIPSRIALYVSSAVDSRTILDTSGAEKLLGNGDMLFNPVGVSKPVRIQGCFVSDEEVERVVDFIKNQKEENEGYDEEIIDEIEKLAAAEKKKGSKTISADDSPDSGADDETMRAIAVVVENQLASTTLLQRKLKIGYAKAARIMDELEEKGVIGPFEGSKPRKVLMSKQQFAEMRALSDAQQNGSDENGGEG